MAANVNSRNYLKGRIEGVQLFVVISGTSAAVKDTRVKLSFLISTFPLRRAIGTTLGKESGLTRVQPTNRKGATESYLLTPTTTPKWIY